MTALTVTWHSVSFSMFLWDPSWVEPVWQHCSSLQDWLSLQVCFFSGWTRFFEFLTLFLWLFAIVFSNFIKSGITAHYALADPDGHHVGVPPPVCKLMWHMWSVSLLWPLDFLIMNFYQVAVLNFNVIGCAKTSVCVCVIEVKLNLEHWCRSALPVSGHKVAAHTHINLYIHSN